MYPSVNNGIAGIPENRLGFVGEATYLPHLHIGVIRKGRPFFWQLLYTHGTSKQSLERLSERCGDSDLLGADGMHFKFIFHRAKPLFLFCEPIPKIPQVSSWTPAGILGLDSVFNFRLNWRRVGQ